MLMHTQNSPVVCNDDDDDASQSIDILDVSADWCCCCNWLPESHWNPSGMRPSAVFLRQLIDLLAVAWMRGFLLLLLLFAAICLLLFVGTFLTICRLLLVAAACCNWQLASIVGVESDRRLGSSRLKQFALVVGSVKSVWFICYYC